MTEIQLPSAAQRATDISQATAVEQARAVAEVAAAVRVAKDFPRDEDEVYAAMRRACSSPRLAERAFYAVQNRGNGPSVHLARELSRIWGNNDYGVRELRRDDHKGESEVLAYAWDQQTNARSSRSFIQPHARMTGSGAQKRRVAFTDLHDIYLSNQNTGARAVRECIFSILPAAFVEEAQELCHQTLAAQQTGSGVPIEESRRLAVEAFTRAGVTVGQLEKRFGPISGWTPETLASTHVLWTSLQRNELTLAEAFEPEEGPARVTVEEINAAAQTGGAGGSRVETSVAEGAAGSTPASDTPAPPQDPASAPEGSPTLNPQGALARAMFALFRDAGLTERDDRLRYAADVVKREISTSSDLTEDEARQVMTSLERDITASSADAAPTDADDASDPAAEDDPTLDPSWGQGR